MFGVQTFFISKSLGYITRILLFKIDNKFFIVVLTPLYFLANFSNPAIPKQPSVIYTKELYINSLIINCEVNS